MMQSEMKEVVTLAVDLCSNPEIYDPEIARDLVDFLCKLKDFDMGELENLRNLVADFWQMDGKTRKAWSIRELMNLALISTNNAEIKSSLERFIKIIPIEE